VSVSDPLWRIRCGAAKALSLSQEEEVAAVNAKTNRLAIYGGAFDPIHNGHLVTIAHLVASGQVDSVVVVPSGDRPDKKTSVSAADRLAMTRIAIEEAFPNDSRVSVSDIHATGKVGYGTIDLVEHFMKQPDTAPCVVIGQELLQDLPAWKEISRLRSLTSFLVIRRPGTIAPQLPKDISASWLSSPYEAGVLVSSTTIRSMLVRGLTCSGLLPPSVVAYCRSHGLYGTQK
jgi:nicotinate-nucleotide adenylyltransferase